MGSHAGADCRLAVISAIVATSLLLGIGAVTSSAVVVGVGLISCAFIAAISPVGALCAVVATLPWFYRPMSVGEQELATSELLLVAGSAGTGLRLVVTWAMHRSTLAELRSTVRWLVTRPILIALGALTVVGFILSLAPYDPSHRADSLREWRWVLAEPLIMILLLSICATTRIARTLLALALIAGAAVAAGQAAVDLVGAGGVAVEGVTRISGPFPHPNALALMVTRVAVLGVAWLLLDHARRRLLAAPAAVTALAVLATFSRGAWGSLAVGVLLGAAHLGRRERVAAFSALVAVLLAAIVVASDRMLSLFSGGSASLRFSIWSSALAMIRDRPLRGYGPDQFLYAYLPRYVRPEAWQERFSSHSHNIILDFWIRLGIIGCAFAFGVVLVSLVATVGVVRRPKPDNALASAAVIALAAAVVHGLVDDAYFSHELAMSGWLLAWLAFQPGRGGAVEGAQDGASPRLRWRGVHRFASLR